MIDTKPTNPKDAIGSSKLPLELVPDTAVAYLALSFLEGASKYGRYNWRVAGVRSSIYRAAMQRHIMKWWNGEDADPRTKVHHLASVMACCAIILDAEVCNRLTDDRPPKADMGLLIDALEPIAAHIRETFKDHSPKQYTIADREVWPGELNDALDSGVKTLLGVPGAAITATETQILRDLGPGQIVERRIRVVDHQLGCRRCGVSKGWRHSPDCPEAYG